MSRALSNKMRYIIVIIICILLNEILSSLALAYSWPVWLDATGTAVAVLVLEPAAGLIVGLINNFYMAIFQYDASSLIYYGVSAAVALIVGVNMRKEGKSIVYRVVTTILWVILASTVISALITIWRTGIPDYAWEVKYYQMAMSWPWPADVLSGLPEVVACFVGTFIVKVYDILVSAMIVAIVYFALPKALKRERRELTAN